VNNKKVAEIIYEIIESNNQEYIKNIINSYKTFIKPKLLKLDTLCSGKKLPNDVQIRFQSIRDSFNNLNLAKELYKPSVDNIEKSLKQTKRKFRSLNFDEETNELTILTKSLEFDNIKVGKFRAGIVLESEFAFVADALKSIDEACPHPHVGDGSICMGNADDIAERAFYEGDIATVFDLINRVMESYNISKAMPGWLEVLEEQANES